MADKSVPVDYRKGKLRAGGLGDLAKLKNGSLSEIPTMGENGPVYSPLSDILDTVLGDTRGSIIRRGATGWEEVSPGNAGEVWTAQGAGADPIYAASTGALVLLDTKTASGSSSLDFTSGIDGTYAAYELHLENVVPATNAVDMFLRVSKDGGSTYETTSYLCTIGGASGIALDNGAGAPISNTAGGGLSGWVRIVKPSSPSNYKHTVGAITYRTSAVATIAAANPAGFWNGGQDVINAIRFIFSAGNISTGVIRLYGIKG